MDKNVTNHKCPNCNAGLPFDPEKGLWVCEYCNSEFTLEELNKSENNTESSNDANMDLYECPSCGAQIIADENTTATFCVYCKNPAIIKSRLQEKFKPQYVIPFKTTKEDAIKAFENYKKNKWFIPDEFNDPQTIQEITGINIPFWLYTCDVDANLSAVAYKIRRWRSGNYRYTKTDTYSITRKGTMGYNKVPADGSKRFDDSIMDSIEPFNYSELKDFDYSYLSGFLSEKYDVTEDEAFDRAEDRIENTSKQKLQSTILGYTTINVNNFTANINNVSNEYVLLPVWLLNTKYKDKLYPFAMNGQTGKLIGNIPISIKKLILKSLFIFLSLDIIIFLIMYLFS